MLRYQVLQSKETERTLLASNLVNSIMEELTNNSSQEAKKGSFDSYFWDVAAPVWLALGPFASCMLKLIVAWIYTIL